MVVFGDLVNIRAYGLGGMQKIIVKAWILFVALAFSIPVADGAKRDRKPQETAHLFGGKSQARVEPTIVTVTDATGNLASTYLGGFTIPANTVVVWNCSAAKKISGAIVFADTTSVLKLSSDLYLSAGGTLVACDNQVVDDNEYLGSMLIDGQGKRLVLDSDITLNNVGKMLVVFSSFIIDGQSKYKLTCNLGDKGFFLGVNNPNLTVQNLTLGIGKGVDADGDYWGLFANFNTTTLSNVTILPLGQYFNKLCDAYFSQQKLIIQGTVRIALPPSVQSKKIQLAGSGALDIVIAAGATLQVGPGIVCEAANYARDWSYCSITMPDKSSTLALQDCSFYTGNIGLALDVGTVKYSGSVNIFNGDYAVSFIPNSTVNNSWAIGSSLKQTVDKDAVVVVNGLTKKVIDDTNASSYLKGFTIPANSVYEWNCSAGKVVTGAIACSNNINARLHLNTSLAIASQSVLQSIPQVTSRGDSSFLVVVDSKNVKNFVSGFKIQPFTTVVWNGGTAKLVGAITREDDTSHLVLASDLYLGANGSINIPFAANNKVVYTQFSRPLVVGINDTNYAKYKDGFVIPAGVTYEWAASGPLNGPVTFINNNTSVLKLGSDLRLGVGGSFVLNNKRMAIDGNGKRIVLECDYTFGGIYISPISDLSIDGQGHVFTLTSNFDDFYNHSGGGAITLKNMTLVFDNDKDRDGLTWNNRDVILENVTVKFCNASGNRFCGPSCAGLTIRGRVLFESPGKPLTLCNPAQGRTSTVFIEKNSELFVGPGVMFELCDVSQGGSCAISMADETARLYLDGCDFYVGDGNVMVTKGTVLFDHQVNIHTCRRDGTPSMASMLAFGDGFDPANLMYLNGATVVVDGVMTVDPTVAAATPRAWSFLTYMQADNNFSSGNNDFTSGAMNAMKEISSNDGLNILIQRDRAGTVGTDRYKILSGQATDVGSLANEMGQDPVQELVDAMTWVQTKFPADNYVLMLWDHGNGVLDGWGNRVRGMRRPSRGILYDYTQGTFVDNVGLKAACANIKTIINKNIAVLGMDACEMAMIEVAYQIKDSVDYWVASQQLSWSWMSDGPAWAFGDGLLSIANNAEIASADVATALVDSCETFYSAVPSSIVEEALDNRPLNTVYTMSAIDLSKVCDAVNAFQALAIAIKTLQEIMGATKTAINKALEDARKAVTKFYHTDSNNKQDYVDLVDLYDSLTTTVGTALLTDDQKNSVTAAITAAKTAALTAIVANVTGSAYDGKAHGLSLYFPAGAVKGSYGDTDFATTGAPAWVSVLGNR